MSSRFVIKGGHRLRGEYPVQGNKNAALPLIAASLLSPSTVVLKRIPEIKDVENLLRLVEAAGVSIDRDGEKLSIDPKGLSGSALPSKLIEKLRGSILILGSLANRYESLTCALPGGCPIGRRSFEAHWKVFRAAGFSVSETEGKVQLRKTRNEPEPQVYFEESSVTATENALILFSALGSGLILNPAREPHVLSLVEFLRKMGCEIELHPLYYRIRSGVSPDVGPISFKTPPDYIDSGTVAIATAITHGEVDLIGTKTNDLQGFKTILELFGIALSDVQEDVVRISVSDTLINPERIVSGLWPSFPTDLISLAIVLATQSQGLCLIHDWLYESRMFFIDKLVRMGARSTLCDPHRVLVEGPTRLRGIRLESPDIRAGMALVVAGLCAEGETTIELAEVIERGYEKVTRRLNGIGAEISKE